VIPVRKPARETSEWEMKRDGADRNALSSKYQLRSQYFEKVDAPL
jgi:hypothetical protein